MADIEEMKRHLVIAHKEGNSELAQLIADKIAESSTTPAPESSLMDTVGRKALATGIGATSILEQASTPSFARPLAVIWECLKRKVDSARHGRKRCSGSVRARSGRRRRVLLDTSLVRLLVD
jgi:hypothetical protein